jgi:carbon monoxide dehydrogenase subunit G
MNAGRARGGRPSFRMVSELDRLGELLARVDASGGGMTLRPTGANVFVRKDGGGWLNYDVKRNAGETMAAMAERALERAVVRWKL